ncbi:MAG: hypothetical protein R6V08_03270 [Desulfuromonadales bacterium]
MKPGLSKHLIALMAAALMLCGASQAMAGGTTSGTLVDNQATLDYQVGGIDQTQVDSNQVDFLVDKKVDLTVTEQDGALVEVTPGATNQVLTFSVTNTGNDVQDVALSATDLNGVNDPFGTAGADNFDATVVGVFVESGDTSGYQSGEDTDTYLDELAPDTAVTVYIVRDIPVGQSDTDVAVSALTGQILAGGNSGTEGGTLTATASGDVTDGEVDILFADAAGTDDDSNDALHSDRSGFLVSTATMTADKAQTITGDHAIPGATVTYSIEVANGGTADATPVIVTDSIPANTTYAAFGTCNGTPEWHEDTKSDGSGDTWQSSEPTSKDAVKAVRCTIATVAVGDTDTVSFSVTID